MNTIPVLIAMILASSIVTMGATTATDEELQANYDQLIGSPFFGNTTNLADLINKFRCGASVNEVYACLGSSLFKLHPQNFNPLQPEDCCTSITNFRDKCSEFNIAKFETFIFPPLLFKPCSGAGASMPAPAPGTASEIPSDIEA